MPLKIKRGSIVAAAVGRAWVPPAPLLDPPLSPPIVMTHLQLSILSPMTLVGDSSVTGGRHIHEKALLRRPWSSWTRCGGRWALYIRGDYWWSVEASSPIVWKTVLMITNIIILEMKYWWAVHGALHKDGDRYYFCPGLPGTGFYQCFTQSAACMHSVPWIHRWIRRCSVSISIVHAWAMCAHSFYFFDSITNIKSMCKHM
jgi:hypothetical protein